MFSWLSLSAATWISIFQINVGKPEGFIWYLFLIFCQIHHFVEDFATCIFKHTHWEVLGISKSESFVLNNNDEVVVSNICFHPYLGKIPILTSIFFQMGWFNHQPDDVWWLELSVLSGSIADISTKKVHHQVVGKVSRVVCLDGTYDISSNADEPSVVQNSLNKQYRVWVIWKPCVSIHTLQFWYVCVNRPYLFC